MTGGNWIASVDDFPGELHRIRVLVKSYGIWTSECERERESRIKAREERVEDARGNLQKERRR